MEAEWTVGWRESRLLPLLHLLDFSGVSLCLWECFHSTTVSSQSKSEDGQRSLTPLPLRFWPTWDVFVDHVEEILPHFTNEFLFITPPPHPPSEPHLYQVLIVSHVLLFLLAEVGVAKSVV